MKICKLLIKALFLAVLSFSLNSLVFAQKTALQSGLTENSSLAGILNWIDKTSLPQARIGLEANFKGPETGEVITTGTRYYEQALFSKVFCLAKIDGYKLILRNDNAELICFEIKYPNPAEGSWDKFRKTQNNQPQLTGEFSIPSKKLKANKAPFRHTKKEEKVTLLGTWRI